VLDLLVLLVLWFIWFEGNARVFNRRSCTVLDVVSHILQELDAWIAARYHSLLALSQGVVCRRSVDAVD
jgi:polysaccharide pyruvyl transferase WcaK-like protein